MSKKRLQFISNSSSSSYIIFGDKISLKDSKEHSDSILFIKENYYGYDEYDYVNLTPEILKVIEENQNRLPEEVLNGLVLANSYWWDPELEGYSVQEKPLDKFSIECSIINDSCGDVLSEFKEKYIGETDE